MNPSPPSMRSVPFARALAGAGLLIASLGFAAETAPAGNPERVEGIAAIVDNEVILLSEVDQAASLVLTQLQAQQGAEPLAPEVIQKVRVDTLQQLIDRRLIRKFAERVDLAATEEDLDQTIAGIAADEGVTPEQIYAAAQAEGLSREVYRRELGDQITQMKVMGGAVRSRVEVTDEEVQRTFEDRYRNIKPGLRATVRQILLPWPGEKSPITRDQAREYAGRIREQAIATGRFAEIARQVSRAPTAANGGLVTLRQGEVAPEVSRWVFDPPVGSISPVVETAVGLNIFQVVDRFDPFEVKLEDVQDQIRAQLVERSMEPAFQRWIEDQRKQFYIEIVAPGLR